MFQSLKDYIKNKTGLAKRSQEVKDLETSLTDKIEFLAAFMNLTWPSRLEIDPVLLEEAKNEISREFGVTGFNTSIHKNDLMFAFLVNKFKHELPKAVQSYFRVGASTADNLKSIADKFGISPGRILDYGSGYGRVSRFLPHFFKDAGIVVSEIKEQSVSFQKEEFEFQGIAHSHEASEFPEGKYDLILALSVFTHLPQKALEEWMKVMMESLNPGGALVFTFFDQDSDDHQELLNYLNMERTPLIYIDRSEDKHFSFVSDSIKDDEQYGSTFVTRKYLKDLVGRQGLEFHFLDRSLVKGQDAAICIAK